MPPTIEQQHSEAQRETVSVPERQSPEIPEYNETGLRELVEQAQGQVETDENRIRDITENRTANPAGIDQQRAAGIFTGRGFSERVRNANERIAGLARRTKERIASLVGSTPENLSQALAELKPELRPGEVPGAMSLDEYMTKHKVAGMEAIKDKARLAQLKIKKIENPERVLGLVKYLEEKAVGYESKTFWVKDTNLEQEQKKYEQQGYFVSPGGHGDKKGKTYLRISRDMPYHFDMANANDVGALVKSGSDPVELFERLQGLGYKLSGYDVSFYSSSIKKFLDNPNVLPLLKKFQAGKLGLPKSQYIFDGYDGEHFLQRADSEATEGKLDEATLKSLSTIKEIIGHPIPNDQLEKWTEIANDQGAMGLLVLARDSGTAFGPYDTDYLMRNLGYFKDAGIASDVVSLVKQGFPAEQFSLNKLDSYMSSQSIQDIVPAVQDLKANPDSLKLMLEISSEMGIAPTVNSTIVKKIRDFAPNPEQALTLLRTVKEFAVEQGTWNEDTLKQILENRQAAETIIKPDFQVFLSIMKGAGYKPTQYDLFPGNRYHSRLLEIYNWEGLKDQIAEEKNTELIQHLNLFSPNASLDVYSLKMLMGNPNALEQIKTLERKFGYSFKPEGTVELQNLTNLLADPEYLSNLCSPETQGLFTTLKDLGYTFDIADFRTLVQLTYNQDFLKKIADPTTIEYLKSIPNSHGLDSIRALTSLDTTCLPVIKTLTTEFGYEFTASSLRETSKFERLRDNPKMLESARALKRAGINFVLSDFEMLTAISDNNLADLIYQYKDSTATKSFIIRNAKTVTDRDWNPAFHTIIDTVDKTFGFNNCGGESLEILSKLHSNPRILETALKLKDEVLVSLPPFQNFDKLKTIVEKNLVGLIQRCQDFPEMRTFILKNVESITTANKDSLPFYIAEILKNSESKPVRDKQMIIGELMGMLLGNKRLDLVEQVAGQQAEVSVETKRAVEKLGKFLEAHKISGKGHTIETLLGMREYREGENFSQMLQRLEKQLDGYERLLDRYSPHNIPQGLRASIGMEYEITNSTAKAYEEASQGGHALGKYMDEVSRFSGLGKGKDAVFEIATKPSDNPYLMLLEMKLLQDLEFIDFNFRSPGYEQGARGYHMTIGGEHGINVSRNSNFLQNTLMMSGWGGINAGRSVDRLSKGRSLNIRQRGTYDTQSVFENSQPAVEFRSLSLDTWEPFERAVETSYFGAIGLQAFEKHIVPLDEKQLADLQADSPEQFYQLLKQKDLVRVDTDDTRTKQIIFEWAKLQRGVTADLADHNENFLQNEMYGYEDERGNYIEASEFGGASNKDRFETTVGKGSALDDYFERNIKIDPAALFSEAKPDLANRCTAITNLFIKSSRELGGDLVNASASLDTTKVGRSLEDSDPLSKYQSFFDVNGKTREGYYYTQGGSEKMLLHKVQMRLLEFNKLMQRAVS